MIGDYYQKVKSYVEINKSDLFTAALIFLVGLGSFGLGRLSVIWPDKEPITITNRLPVTGTERESSAAVAAEAAAIGKSVKGKYVVSKSGKYYHFPWCPGALRIKEANKIWFQTKEAAEAKGYKPASNCPGL